MKILWVKTDFLHPTTRGGQIRTLEMLRQLHKRHEIHYVAFDDKRYPESLARAPEYSSHKYPVHHEVVPKNSPQFALQLLHGVIAPLPVAVMRYRSGAMLQAVVDLEAKISFDAKVCDFPFPSVNLPDLRDWTLFQHNVEFVIWERNAQSGRTPLHRAYFASQARKMFTWERQVCRSASNVIAVSDKDASVMRDRFGLAQVEAVPTGVDVAFFECPSGASKTYDLVFVGSMDWMPNVDGMRWFLGDVLPIIRASLPGCKVAIVGRNPPASIAAQAKSLDVEVTGTVPDVRPYLWGARASIVPLRIGGGTRLKIFEAMAAGTPVISTTIGAEGLPVEHGKTIQIADSPQTFAACCLRILTDPLLSELHRTAALGMVVQNFSWEQVTERFERAILQPRLATAPRA